MRQWLITHRFPLIIFAFGFSLFSFTLRGYLSLDEEGMFLVTQSIVDRGEVSVSAKDSLLELPSLRMGADGREYGYFELGHSLIALPAMLVGKGVAIVAGPEKAKFATRFVVNHMGALFGALALVVFYLCALQLGAKPKQALLLTLLLALCTPLWYYSRTFYRASHLAFLTIAATTALFRFRLDPRMRWLIVAGLACGLATMVKVTSVLICIPVLAYVLSVRKECHLIGTRFCTHATAFLLPIVGGLLVGIAYNYARWGSWAFQDPNVESPLSGSLIEGLWGLLLSPGRGLLLFCAPLLILLYSVPKVWKQTPQRRPEFIFIALLSITTIILHAKWAMWWAGDCWGPRFLIPLIPVLFLGLISYESSPPRRWPRLRGSTLAIAILCLHAFAVELHGVLLEGRNLRADAPTVEQWRQPLEDARFSSALNPEAWYSIFQLQWSPVTLAQSQDAVQDDGYTTLRQSSASVWWAFILRSFPRKFMVPAVLELAILIASGLYLMGKLITWAPMSESSSAKVQNLYAENRRASS